MSRRALIYGTIAVDTLLTPKGEANSVLGGSGPYAALAARLQTDNFDLVGVLGSDFPEDFRRRLEGCGVSLRHVDCAEGETFAWTGQYEEDMNHRRTLRTVEGVQATWTMRLPTELQAHRLAVLCNVTPPLQYRMLEQCLGARFTMADFMKSWLEREPDYSRRLVERVDMVLMNDEEAQCFTGCEDSVAAGYALLAAGPLYAVVKHGSAGSTLFHRQEDGSARLFRCPAWPLPHAEDPTGAGDAFMGALAGYLLEHDDGTGTPAWEVLQRGIVMATLTAAAVCESFGTDALMRLRREDLRERVEAFHAICNWPL